MDSDIYLSDDGLEDFNEDDLATLEAQAIQSTQVIRPAAPQAQPRPHHHHPPPATEYVTLPTLRSSPSKREERQASSDYGDFNETIELWDTAGPTAPAPTRPVHNGAVAHTGNGGDKNGGYGMADHQAEYDMLDDTYDGDLPVGNVLQQADAARNTQSDAEKEELRRALEQLNKERETLLQELNAVKDAAMAKTGEISIVRSNIDRQTKEHQRMLQTVTTQQQEEREKHLREKRALEAEIERYKTDNAFLKNDMDLIVKRNRTTEHRPKIEPGKRQGSLTVDLLRPDSPSTPRKNKGLNYMDGFNDREMMSPTKAARAGSRTPSSRHGSKRKRAVQDSPLFELPMSQNRTPTAADAPQMSQSQTMDHKVLDRLHLDEESLEFYEFFVARKSQAVGLSTLEALASFRLPSEPSESSCPLSTLFMGAFSNCKAEYGDEDLIATICRAVLSVWEDCMEEQYYPPINLLMELVGVCLDWTTLQTVFQISDMALKLIQETVDLVALPRFQKEQLATGASEIDLEAALRLMHSIGNFMCSNEEYKSRFWKKIRMDFPFMLVDQCQSIPHIQRMLQILQLSIWSDSFGPREPPGVEPKKVESALLDRIGKLLNEDPKPISDGSPQTSLIQMRLEIINFLGVLIQTPYGLDSVAEHPSLICRLVRRISDEVDEMYRFCAGVSLSVSFINHAIRLLHGVLTLRSVDLAERLSRIPGTTHKYVSSMTRVAFSEGLVQEAGLEPEVVDRAYGLVEVAVTPEEAEALESLFRRRD